ncbi:MAG: response regulator [Kiritimatiellia bacterium]|nr:response regulator [Lentisphaerota bacterium]
MAAQQSAKNQTILLVDDDREFLESGRAVLESAGYTVLTAENGATGLELARREKPALIMLDMMMDTNTEGMEVSRRIRETSELRDVPILMVTGARAAMHLPFRFEPDAHHLPVSAILEKPLAPEVLLREVSKHLGA